MSQDPFGNLYHSSHKKEHEEEHEDHHWSQPHDLSQHEDWVHSSQQHSQLKSHEDANPAGSEKNSPSKSNPRFEEDDNEEIQEAEDQENEGESVSDQKEEPAVASEKD